MRLDNEDYADLIVFYLNNPALLNSYKDAYIRYMNEAFAIIHVPVSQITQKAISLFGYTAIPKLYGLTSEESLRASGVLSLRGMPGFDLQGSGVLIGIIDTGIDYTNPVFIKSNGTSKVLSIWDQTIAAGTTPPGADFGSEYNNQQINQALASEDPFEIVPSIDEIGHGTMLAGVAAGNKVPGAGFAGVAPESDLIIVKLRQAKDYLKDFFIVPKDIPCYQENHIMWGVQYCTQLARSLNRPIVILTGMGTSQGSHNGYAPLPTLLSIIGDYPNTAVVVPAGNEGILRRHYHNNINDASGFCSVELNVAENEDGFSMEFWGDAFGIYAIDILSPGGEFIPRISAAIRLSREISFIFEGTRIYIDFQLAQTPTGEPLILIRFQNITPGTWKFNVYNLTNVPCDIDIWLPMGNMITSGTYFINADDNVTLLEPGTAALPITITAYDIANNNLYINAGRGYTRDGTIKPELAAPGVNYIAPNQNKEFVPYTGTGVAAAHTAGIVAMIFEWAVIKGNRPGLDTIKIKNYLVRGAIRDRKLTYPNRSWGYGIINVNSVFEVLKN